MSMMPRTSNRSPSTFLRTGSTGLCFVSAAYCSLNIHHARGLSMNGRQQPRGQATGQYVDVMLAIAQLGLEIHAKGESVKGKSVKEEELPLAMEKLNLQEIPKETVEAMREFEENEALLEAAKQRVAVLNKFVERLDPDGLVFLDGRFDQFFRLAEAFEREVYPGRDRMRDEKIDREMEKNRRRDKTQEMKEKKQKQKALNLAVRKSKAEATRSKMPHDPQDWPKWKRSTLPPSKYKTQKTSNTLQEQTPGEEFGNNRKNDLTNTEKLEIALAPLPPLQSEDPKHLLRPDLHPEFHMEFKDKFEAFDRALYKFVDLQIELSLSTGRRLREAEKDVERLQKEEERLLNSGDTDQPTGNSERKKVKNDELKAIKKAPEQLKLELSSAIEKLKKKMEKQMKELSTSEQQAIETLDVLLEDMRKKYVTYSRAKTRKEKKVQKKVQEDFALDFKENQEKEDVESSSLI